MGCIFSAALSIVWVGLIAHELPTKLTHDAGVMLVLAWQQLNAGLGVHAVGAI
jgi:hypothetical protein